MRAFRRAAALAVVAALAVAVLPVTRASAIYCAPWDNVCRQLQQEQGKQDANRSKLANIEQNIRDTEAKGRAIGDLIRSLDAQVGAEEAAIASTQQRIDVLDAQIRVIAADLVRRQAHIQAREDLLGARVRAMDKHGDVNYLELVFSSSSFSDLLDRVVMMQEIIRSDHQLVDDLRHEKEQVQEVERSLQAKRDQQAVLLSSQQAQEASLQTARADQQAALDYQKQLEKQFEAQRQELERELRQIQYRIQYLQAEYAAEARAAGGGSGHFIWPEGGQPPISQGFGCTDLVGEPYWPSCPTRHFHMGIDLAGPFGTPIYAADSGVASVFFDPCCGYGNYIVITHGNGWSTFYGHLSAFAVGYGQLVYRGQVIGYEGSTGYSTGPHLHFGINYYGSFQNPCVYLGC